MGGLRWRRSHLTIRSAARARRPPRRRTKVIHRRAAVDPHEPSQPGPPPRPAARGLRHITGLVTALTLALGGSLAMALPATAGPADPITMPDDTLRACINAELGQGDSDPITEAQAAEITTVDCQTMGITDITGLETMPNLETVWLNNNSGIANLDPIKNLTKVQSLSLNFVPVANADLPGLVTSPDLTGLGLWGNGLTDISALSAVTSLRSLTLRANQITDVSPLATLNGLNYLYLEDNEIADVSPLSALTNLETLQLSGQSLNLPSAPLSSPTTNPVADVSGNPVPPTSTDAGFNYDSTAHTWTFATRGTKSLTWDTTVSIGSAAGVQFSGTITQRISFAHAMPETPTVTQTACMNGDVIYPQITLPDTEGIEYTIVGDVAPGETVIIEAVPADENHAIHVDPDSDWVDASGDHIYATLEITLDDPDCDIPEPIIIDAPNGDLPVDDPCGSGNARWILPTGSDIPVGFTWQIADDGLLTAVADEGHVFSDPTGSQLDPRVREYGYAPDTGEECPVEESTTPQPTQPEPAEPSEPAPTQPAAPEPTDPPLADTGGPALGAAGIAAVALLSSGGLIASGALRRRR